MLVGVQGPPAHALLSWKALQSPSGAELQFFCRGKPTAADITYSPVLRNKHFQHNSYKSPFLNSSAFSIFSLHWANNKVFTCQSVFKLNWTSSPSQSHPWHLSTSHSSTTGHQLNSALLRYPLRHLPADDWIWTPDVCRHNLQWQIIKLPSNTVQLWVWTCRISWPKAKAVKGPVKDESRGLRTQWSKLRMDSEAV